MEKIKNFFEYLDQFNIPISFRYQKDDNYSTLMGGLISFIIIALSLIFGIYHFIPFVKKENFSLYYYYTNLNETEEINLKKTKSALTFRFDSYNIKNSEKYDNIGIEDLLELKVSYIFYTNNGENKDTKSIGIHNCTNADFYNDKNLINSLDKNKFGELKCFDDLNQVIKNRYQDKQANFTYFEIDIEAKNNTFNLC